MEKNFKRAKSKENKQIRMNEIMTVTESLFKNNTYHEITLTTIAKELNMARGNLYKYVMSKEEIFLLIYLKKQKETITNILFHLNQEKNISVSLLAKIISESLYNNFDYIKYHQIMNAIIETNVSIEKLADFKISSYQDRQPLFKIMIAVCNLESIEQASNLYLMIIYHSCYLYDRVAYHDTYKQAMELANLSIIPVNFKEALEQFITMCLTNYYSTK